MEKKKIEYKNLLDIFRIRQAYTTIRYNTKHKDKIFKFETYYSSNLVNIQTLLEKRLYSHGKYNIFIISEPKYRIIMSENMIDKIVNHLVSYNVLNPLIEPLLIDANVATRTGKGLLYGIEYVKKYINSLKINNDKIYVLKCDISKYFYNIDQDILLDKLSLLIEDQDIFNLVKNIIYSTKDASLSINESIDREKRRIDTLDIPFKEKELKKNELDKLYKYEGKKGIPIGNMTSQILAIFYLNDLDHYIKEVLGIKCYVRYMDDFLLIHPDKEYLKYCLSKIEEKLKDVKLSLNAKTQIIEVHNGFNFLGRKFILKDKKLYVLMSSSTKKKIKKKIKNIPISERSKYLKEHYNGYLSYGDNKGFIYHVTHDE